MKRRHFAIGSLLCALLLAAGWVHGQQPEGFSGNKVMPLIKVDLTGVANKQVIANIYEVPPGAMVPRHFHHGDEFHLVLAGQWMAEVQGKAPHLMKAGDAQFVEREHWHGAKVVGETPLRVLGVMIVDKDKPILEIVKQ